jgi:ATP-dependent DNA helicase RecG
MPALAEIELSQLKGVGAKLTETLAKLDIHNLQDLLFHLPFRYEDRTRIHSVGSLRPGMQGLFEVEVDGSRVVQGRRRSLEVKVSDDSGSVTLRFYYFNASQARQLSKGTMLRCYGEARLGKLGVEFYHPEYSVMTGEENKAPDKLTPVYPATEGLQQPRIRAICQQALSWLERCDVQDLLPEQVRTAYQLPELKKALYYLHQPPVEADQLALLEGRHICQSRLIVEELLAHHLSLMKLRQSIQAHPALVCKNDSNSSSGHSLGSEFLELLPFSLTGAQSRVVGEIDQDLSSGIPMLRLIQGDVGSGKTVVAALAALRVMAAGAQVALMAPTEILAEQHLSNFQQWFESLRIDKKEPINIAWLSGKTKGKAREKSLEAIRSGEANIVIGTHALFQDSVEFHALALAIIDEQHRFGVHQRLSLKNKGLANGWVPHQLIMTATPIPRTLAMSAYADLDTSVIDELPPGRQKIETFAIPDTRRMEMVDRVRQSCLSGCQVYWVCTLIEDSEALQCQAAEDTLVWLQELLEGLVVGLVHGRMKAKDKSLIMGYFKAGKIDVLVATTVIEVGVDVPNASLIIIENPERLGLAQLHQLRGRVGRGSLQSYCALMYHPPLSANGKERLSVMRESNDGFVIAEKDLELRGPGEVLGTRQTGMINFKLADLQRDQDWLPEVKKIAPSMLNQKKLCEQLIQRWIGSRRQYGEV